MTRSFFRSGDLLKRVVRNISLLTFRSEVVKNCSSSHENGVESVVQFAQEQLFSLLSRKSDATFYASLFKCK